MPQPDEVAGCWDCIPNPDGRACTQTWQMCDACDGEAGPDDKCAMCTGSGGGYICATHDT